MAKNIKLTILQKDTLIFFSKNLFAKNFYWTGGTLLSYCYLHHRNSVDLDFFSNDLFSDDQYLIFINELKKFLKADKIILNVKNNRRLYLIKRKKEIVKLELVYFPFVNLEKRKKISEFSIKVDSLTDIMVNKTLSAYQRKEVKDAYDLYFYLRKNPKYSLEKLINLVEKKFGVQIEPLILLSKINALLDNLNSLKPLLLNPEKELNKKIRLFFQDNFNIIAKKKIK
ncbi:MAG: nucleotidyl transferase AbiEii/AbiGii toxin family protein [Patescibacteria group bacterium]